MNRSPAVMSPGRLRSLVPVAAILAASAGCADPTPDGPSVLLVTLDTTRADRIGAYGHAAAATPTIDALAARGLRFTSAYAPTPITLPSHVSMLTGTYPTAHGVRNNGLYRTSDESLLVSELLAQRGWRTGAFVGSIVLGRRTGLDQGFDVYDAPDPSDAAARAAGLSRSAAEVVDAATDWLELLGPDEPFFLWTHFYDPHAPYAAPEPWASQFADPYDAEIAYADAQLARLLSALAARGLDRQLLIVLTADHGEGLGEHGEPGHGVFLYDAMVRVPLIIVPPGGAPGVPPGGARLPALRDEAVTVTAVAATILDGVGIPAGELPDAGAPSLLGPPARDDAIYLESLLPYHHHRWHPLRGVVWRGAKYVESPRPELYDLAADPGETLNLAASDPARAAALSARLAGLLDEHAPLGWQQDAAIGAEQAEHLAQLGYLSASKACPSPAALR